jgi:acyl-[acyl-carrier-protein]-phospholipid O-acyltransferase/long-chain-fatty-acid--[acyl-carrier-protein] ligase
VVHRVTSDLDPVPFAWLKKAKSQATQTCLINFDGKKYKGSKLLIAVLLFTKLIREKDKENKRVGILLPSSSGSAITNLAALAIGKTVVNLNYTSSPDVIRYCLEKAEIRTIYTSSVFLERLRQRGIDIDNAIQGYEVVILEEVSKNTSRKTLLKTAVKVLRTPASTLIADNFANLKMDDEAAILFSSGSEGKPKGIVLTHRNLVSNIHQISILLAQRKNDCLLNSLPPFHAFGFTVTMLFPLVDGIRQVCAPDPTDAAFIGKLVGDYRCTILFATSTFANIYTKSPKTTPQQFENLRYVVLGAEKLRAEVRMGFESKFGKKTYEGYGTTECTPVVSVNLPDFVNKRDGVVQMSNLYGSVGQAVPGTACIIVDPETNEELPIGEAGLILVSGPQLMEGYLHLPEKTNEVTLDKYGLRWYRTGDKGIIDNEGFIRIVDRYSRFAKIGGEMISLAMVEDHIMKILGEAEIELSAVALPDRNKGEMITLLIANLPKGLDEIRVMINNSDMQSLHRPKKIIAVESIPKLGSGKTDFSATRRLAKEIVGES